METNDTAQPDRASLQAAFDLALGALRGQQHRFVLEYLKDGRGRDAAIRAGYSARTAAAQASRMLTIVNIKSAIEAGQALAARDAVMDAQEVLARLTEHARGSLAPFLRITPDGDLRGFELSTDQPLHLLKKASHTKRTIREMTEETVTIELYDAQAALTLLGKHHRLFVDRTEVTGKDGAPVEVSDARSRLLDRLARRAPDADESGADDAAGGTG